MRELPIEDARACKFDTKVTRYHMCKNTDNKIVLKLFNKDNTCIYIGLYDDKDSARAFAMASINHC